MADGRGRQGRPGGIRALVRRHAGETVRLRAAYLAASDLADEVIQETYLKIWHNAGTFDPKLATPIAWMVAIARNRAIDVIRKQGEASIEDEPAAMEAAGRNPTRCAPRDDRGVEAPARLPRPARAGPPAHGAARLLQRLEPGPVAAKSTRRPTRSRPGCAAASWRSGSASDHDHGRRRDGFAAEYVLGTLDADERAQADALMLVDQDFAAKVRQWERRLGELNALVAPVEPPAPVWERIRARSPSAGQSETCICRKCRRPPIAGACARAPRSSRCGSACSAGAASTYHRPDGGLSRRHRAGARIQADALPPDCARSGRWSSASSRSRSKWCAKWCAKCPRRGRRSSSRCSRRTSSRPAFVMSVDIDKRIVTVRQVAAERLADKSYQLWIATAARALAPQSLGVLGE